MDRLLIKASFSALLLYLSTIITTCFAGVWEQVSEQINKVEVESNYEILVSMLELLVGEEEITRLSSGTLLIAGGYVTIDPEFVRSYKIPGDDSSLEFEFPLTSGTASTATEKEERPAQNSITIMIDSAPGGYSLVGPIGNIPTYEMFSSMIQERLINALRERGANVEALRPKSRLKSSTIDHINQSPPDILISLQFNANGGSNFSTFSSGGFLGTELRSERMRARFIESLLTSKPTKSARLAAALVKAYVEEFQVDPFRSSSLRPFEGNALPIKSCESDSLDCYDIDGQSYAAGIFARNLLLNGIFSQVFIAPFPDYQWLKTTISAGEEDEWINRYVHVILRALY